VLLSLSRRSLSRCSEKVPTKQKKKQRDCNNNSRVPVAISCFALYRSALSPSSVGKCKLSVGWYGIVWSYRSIDKGSNSEKEL